MEYKKMFQEDKFYRKFGVDNRAKQSYNRFIKKLNNKRFRNYLKNSLKTF